MLNVQVNNKNVKGLGTKPSPFQTQKIKLCLGDSGVSFDSNESFRHFDENGLAFHSYFS